MAPGLSRSKLSFNTASTKNVSAWTTIDNLNRILERVCEEQGMQVGRILAMVGFSADGAKLGRGIWLEAGELNGISMIGQEVGDDGVVDAVRHFRSADTAKLYNDGYGL